MDHQAFAQLLGNYGEFVGAIAVVGTLLYLAIQVRQSREATEANTKQLESAALREMAARMENRSLLLARDSGLADRALRMETDPSTLTGLETVQLYWYMASWMADYEEAYRQHKLGTIPEAALNSRTYNMQRLTMTPLGQDAWNTMAGNADPDFVEWASSALVSNLGENPFPRPSSQGGDTRPPS